MNKLVGWLVLFCLLITVSFNFAWAGWLSFVALIPLFIFIEKAREDSWSNTRIIKYVWVAGLLFNLLVLLWWSQIQVETGNSAASWQYGLIKVVNWLITGLVGSLGVLTTITFITKLKLDLLKPSSLFYIPSLWVLGEFIRSYVCSVIWWSPEAYIGAYWNFGALGVNAASTPIGYMTRLTGLFGFGLVTVMINLLIYWLVKKRNVRLAIGSLVTIVLLTIIMFVAYYTPNGRNINVGLIQLSTFGHLDTESFKSAIKGSNQKTAYDVFVLPEYSLYFSNPSGNVKKEIFGELFKNKPGLLVSAGGPDIQKDGKTLQLVHRNENMKPISVQEKTFLIPIGEYMPTAAEILVKATGKQKLLDQYLDNRSILHKADKPEQPVSYNGIVYGSLACSGSLTSQPFQMQTNQGAQILTSNASLGAVEKSAQFRYQSMQMIRFTTIANARSYVQASRGGYSYIIDHNGKVVVKNWADSTEIVANKIKLNNKKTPYSAIGDIGVPIALIAVLYLLASAVIVPKLQNNRRPPRQTK